MFTAALLIGLGFFAAAAHALLRGSVPPITYLGQMPSEPVRREDGEEYFRAVVGVYLLGGVAMTAIAFLRFG